jgi:Fis family transcriptional regulator, factor for inversion stimulation protein
MTDKQPIPLSKCVEHALQQYFEQLSGEPPRGMYDLVMTEVERPLLERVMLEAGSNQSKAARYLGINRNTLRSKLSRYSLCQDSINPDHKLDDQ